MLLRIRDALTAVSLIGIVLLASQRLVAELLPYAIGLTVAAWLLESALGRRIR